MFTDEAPSISFSSVSSLSSISNSTVISRSSIFSQHDPSLFSNQNTISEVFPSRRENNMNIQTRFNFITPINTSQEKLLEQDISLPGSPLLTTNRDSCSYTSVVTYMQKHFNTPNLCKLEHKTCGLKRVYGEAQTSEEERAWIEADHELQGTSRRLKKLKLSTSPMNQEEIMETPMKVSRFRGSMPGRILGESGMYRGNAVPFKKVENTWGNGGGLAPFNLDVYKGQCYENYMDENKQKMFNNMSMMNMFDQNIERNNENTIEMEI